MERFCYLIEYKRPESASTVIGILKILIRFARHSLSVASNLVDHEKLLPLIRDNFLPLKSAHQISGQLIYDQPVHYALKLMRLLMMWGRTITKKILDPNIHDLGPRILCYLSIEPEMMQSSSMIQESLRLIVEAGRTWITTLRYGLGTHLFVDYHSVLMKYLVYFNAHLRCRVTLVELNDSFNTLYMFVCFAQEKQIKVATPGKRASHRAGYSSHPEHLLSTQLRS